MSAPVSRCLKVSPRWFCLALFLLSCPGREPASPHERRAFGEVMPPQAVEEALARTDSRVSETWRRHDLAFAQAAHGDTRGPEFGDASRFFEETTELRLHLNISSYVGALPTAATGEDLVSIREWLVRNADRLYWDKATGTVKVRPPPN